MIYIEKKRFEELKKQNPDYITKAVLNHTFNGKTCRAGIDHIAFEVADTNNWYDTSTTDIHVGYLRIYLDSAVDAETFEKKNNIPENIMNVWK